MNAVTQYAVDVVFGDYGKLCGKWEIAACKRHLNDLDRAQRDDFPYVFDETRAERIFTHFSLIPRTDIEGKNIELEPWQKFDYGSIFGWVRKDDGRRRFSKAYTRNPRGHAKTTGAAGTAIYIMCGDALYPPGRPELAAFEMQPEIDIVAVDRFQGRKAREDMATMGEASPAISKRLSIKRSYIRHKTRGGEVVVFSKDAKNKNGGRPSLIITEEWEDHQSRDLHNKAAKGMGKRAQCLDLMILTAGEDAENKPAYQDDLQYKRVLDGEIVQDDVFIMIREIDDDDDPHNTDCWCKANAFFRAGSEYGRHLFDIVKAEYDDAYGNNDLAKIRDWLIYRMNRWQAEAANKYFTGCMAKLKAQLMPPEEFRKLTYGISGVYGFDLGKTRDLSGSAYAARLPDGRLAFAIMGFMPQNRAAEHERSDRVPYLEWAKGDYVQLTPGDVTDNQYVEQWIYDCEDRYKWTADEIGYDGHNAVDMAIRMREKYNDEDKVVEIPQTCAGLNQATKRFRELVLAEKVVGEYNPLLIWCLNNAVEITNNYGDIKLSKRHKDDTQRIDPVAALMNALARLIVKIDAEPTLSEKVKKRGYVIG